MTDEQRQNYIPTTGGGGGEEQKLYLKEGPFSIYE